MIDIGELWQAIGLATTAVPNMIIDTDNPIGMMQRVVDKVQKLGTTEDREEF